MADAGRLAGKRAIVTGAARGIGRAIAEALAAEGARVVLTDVLAAEGEEACASVGAGAAFRLLDVTDEQAWAELARELEPTPPDVLVNNAGGLLDRRPLHEADLETWHRTLELNLTSVFLGMRAVLPLMVTRGRGSIINVCSVSGIAGQPDAPAYQAAKAGVLLLTKNAAVTYGANGVRVNALTPSVVSTPGLDHEGDDRTAWFLAKIPLQRISTPAEVAAAAIFLASDDSAYVTGANLVVDGGYLA